MTNTYRSPGKTTLTPDVLLTIARMAALGVEGVQEMAPARGGGRHMIGRAQDGVRIAVEDNQVSVELFLVLKHDHNIRDVSRDVQRQVARAIAEMTGMEIGHVNIHIQDIDYPEEA
ncbi:MAG: Asp23/Gls24 family envelope stress response protein [Anaerolineales bacterium]|nr:Asp23/Gls24 family envelope stress response protein [Anaerolineales bacterium]